MAFVMSAFLTLPIPFGKTAGLFVFLLAALTDYWDGRLARGRSEVTAFGQLMDPLVDKILIGAAFISFVAMHQIVPAWIVIIIIAREFIVTGFRLLAANRGQMIPAGRWGKHKTVWQIAVIITILFGVSLRDELLPLFMSARDLQAFLELYHHWFKIITFWLSAMVAIFTVVSGSLYFREWRHLIKET